jgi:hypothetical protein
VLAEGPRGTLALSRHTSSTKPRALCMIQLVCRARARTRLRLTVTRCRVVWNKGGTKCSAPDLGAGSRALRGCNNHNHTMKELLNLPVHDPDAFSRMEHHNKPNSSLQVSTAVCSSSGWGTASTNASACRLWFNVVHQSLWPIALLPVARS